jgi:predicted nucleic acid-binding protein
MIYIDTSSLLKLVFQDSWTEATRMAISAEMSVVVSSLTELEAKVQCRAVLLGGKLKRSRATRLRNVLLETLSRFPFVSRELPASVFQAALVQNEKSKVHCRSLDRIHLAGMAEMRISRLMSHDDRQADAARDLGFEVIRPGMD